MTSYSTRSHAGNEPRTAFDLGVEAYYLGKPRVPPAELRIAKRNEWMHGWDKARAHWEDEPSARPLTVPRQ